MFDFLNSPGTITRAYKLTSRYDATNGLYEMDASNNTCSPAAPMSFYVYFYTKEIGPTSFVEGAFQDGPKGSRIQEKRVATSAGLEVQASLFDTQRNELCQLMLQNNGAYRCLPTVGVAWSTSAYFDSNKCTGSKLFSSRMTTCVPPKYAVTRDKTECSHFKHSVSSIGTAVSQVYTAYSDGSCHDISTLYSRYFHEGSVLPTSTFVSGSYTAFSSPGRIQPYLGHIDGLTVPSGLFWDSKNQTACKPQPTSDGVLRCLPSPTYLVSFAYLDNKCTTRVLGTSCEITAKQKLIAVEEEPTATCTKDFTRVFTRGPEISPPPPKLYHFTTFNGAKKCVEQTTFSRVYALGTEQAPTDFVEAKELIE